jgi:hypothetical protein
MDEALLDKDWMIIGEKAIITAYWLKTYQIMRFSSSFCRITHIYKENIASGRLFRL